MPNINGAWTQDEANTYHQSSPKLANFLKSYLPKDENVYDFGCGNAYYISELAKEGFQCTGIEGCPLNNFLHPNVIVADLTKRFKFGVEGSVISLEVIEHIEKEFEQIVLDTITNHCDGKLIFSWALTGQPGIGHVNCVDQSYAISEIERRGFKYLEADTKYARTQVDSNCDWFERTLLIFEKI